MLSAEAIPYRSFKEKIRIVKQELEKNRYIEVCDKFIYSVGKNETGELFYRQCVKFSR